jgi:hypothetical protein
MQRLIPCDYCIDSSGSYHCRGGCRRWICNDCVKIKKIQVIDYEGFDSEDENEIEFVKKYADTFVCENCQSRKSLQDDPYIQFQNDTETTHF